MPIVLAIEPDRRQAAHLTAIVRHQVGAELLLADTTEGALDAIGNRVPDLVLVPALLSPTDDAALAAALRVIAAAAHVRTLTIPVLANGVARTSAGGMLAKWRKGRASSPEPDGCDPAVFGEQITAYLEEAAAERARLEDDLASMADEPVFEVPQPQPPLRPLAATSGSAPELRPLAATLGSDPELQPLAATLDDPELQPLTATFGSDPELQPMAATPDSEVAWVGATPLEAEEPLIDLSEELAELEGEVDSDELFDGERVGVYTISADEDVPALESFDLLPAILDQEAAIEDEVATPAEAAAVSDVEPTQVAAGAAPLSVEPPAPAVERATFVQPAAVFVEPPEPPRADIQPWVPMFLTPGRLWPTLEGVPAEMPVLRAEQPDWIELVASLRQDLERKRTEPAHSTIDPLAARPSDGVHAEPRALVKKPRLQAKKAKPVQDEWGFFDPEQCGFSTLLAKLEEITDDVNVPRG